MLKEFKEFAMRGSVIDLAIGLILGVAFGKIVSSLVNDIIMPPLSLIFGRINFTDLFIPLDGNEYATLADAQAVSAPTINYGFFIITIVEFIIVAFAIFLVVRQINKLQKAPESIAPNTKDCPYCFTQIPIPATRCPHCTTELQ